ncbi:TonB-dependent receptor [Flavitalea sp. BT771]|uniref:SusC/RagA family TonB-linked outer membrane protein n=1 Tax=Flavitalea sp. BT771 TaxID=3063329 RepID=UPI0026E21334|nr:TonB-dependent receptor [Flavitalea sp. BT771]MDO6431924.1 TonB-dependent receptor [Flavitalea sp. BT771]MDV6220833.1 TonB-dependent receptor [Flavitalea sp. BT771]
MKSYQGHFLHRIGFFMIQSLLKRRFFLSVFLVFSFYLTGVSQSNATITASGIITDSSGVAMAQVTVTEKGTANATSTGSDGRFTLRVAGEKSVLVITSIGYTTVEIRVGGKKEIKVSLERANKELNEIVVVGFGTRKKESLTGAIATVTAKDLGRVHGGSTVSSGLAGKLPGVTFRMPDGRPGASANIQIRNMGTPLYVIDGIQQDETQFNNLAPNDIESISVLKDGSAAIYGVRAANGVVVVTTKKGLVGRNNVNVDAYTGIQNWSRFPKVLTNSYEYMSYRADAEMNSFGSTAITPEILAKYKQGAAAGPEYRSFDWRSYVMNNQAPQRSLNVNINGGSDKVNYYVSATNFFQNSVLGKEYKFGRTNVQANITAKITSRLKVGVDMNGRSEFHENPGVPGGDDYFLARLAILRNTPTERPYANDNPAYLNDLGPHLESNYAFLNEGLSGRYRSDKRVVQANMNVEYQVPGITGLSLKGVYSYYFADYLENNQEYTYKAYTYHPDTKEYVATGGSTNPWRDREQIKNINITQQFQVNYANTFGKHNIGATFVAERIQIDNLRNWLHASPISNNLPLVYFPITDQYQDAEEKEARIGYIGRITYSYANRYFFEASARRDASYLFAPDKRVGYFPGVSAGWRITEEPWFRELLNDKRDVLTDLKLRASYGQLGDDRTITDALTLFGAKQPIVPPYAYLSGYNYNQGTAIIDGNPVTVSRDKGVPITRVSWSKSKITDIGVDFSWLNGKLTGTIDYFYRKRSGLLGTKNDVVVPIELGYSLPQENTNSDAQYGEELSLNYNGRVGELTFNVGGNVGFTRSKFLRSYKPVFNNSLDQYRNSAENRYQNLDWGYTVIGQFKSMEEIRDYKVDIDGKGNTSLLPGDLIYKDFNGDGKIDGNDDRPLGFGYGRQPNVNFGFTIGAAYKGFDFHADFSGAGGYTWYQNWEQRWAFQNNGNLNTIFRDRWHRKDPFDLNSEWIAGKYPANRYNVGNGHSDYNHNSTFWLHNVRYIRARTIEFGYTLPSELLSRVKVQRARVYVNAYNLFSIDNLRQYGVDPETVDDNGLQFPQNRVLNVGVNLTF